MGKSELYEHYETDSLYGFNEDVAIIDNHYIFQKNGTGWRITKDGLFELSQSPNNHGYLRFTMWNEKYYSHRVIAMLFIPNPEGLKEISHEDNDKTNNSVENLKWCTRQYNNKKIFTDGIRTSEEMSRISKMQKPKGAFTKRDIQNIKRLYDAGLYESQIATIYGCSRGLINSIRRGKSYARYKDSV